MGEKWWAFKTADKRRMEELHYLLSFTIVYREHVLEHALFV